MTDTKYNGWTNYETWLCNLWFDDWSDLASEYEDVNELAGAIKSYVEEYMEAQVQESNGFVSDLINAAVSEIAWYEIAENYEEDLKKPEPADEEEQDEVSQ